MEVHDMRGQPILTIFKLDDRFPARTHHTTGIEHVHREVTDNEINEYIDKAHELNAEMVMIQEYGITLYVPNNPVI